MEKLMKYILLFFIAFISSVLFISCSDLKDNIPAAPEITTHGSGVFDKTASNYHGKQLVESPNNFQDCKQCHAADYSGGIAKVSCYSSGCHPYPTIDVHEEGIVDTQSTNFHGKFIVQKLDWDMRPCGSCHSANYSGGTVSPSCLTCHTGTNGPEACNTCHGDFNDPTKIAPPRALNGSTETSYPGVGAHTSHLYANTLGNEIRCSSCHKYPQSVYTEGHIDNDGKAEIIFGKLSIQGGANPSYDFNSNNCSNTYCHGNFTFYRDSTAQINKFVYTAPTITGNNFTAKWNKVDGTQAACGTCHGLPPEGHLSFKVTDCFYCHGEVVDSNGNIIDQTKHINGIADVKLGN
jgi:hypothetical protein